MNILIIGATSAVATAYARLQAEKESNLYLLGRSEDKLKKIQLDLKARGASKVELAIADFSDTQQHAEVISNAFKAFGRIDTVLVAHGTLPDQGQCQTNVDKALAEFHINATSTFSLLSHIANEMEQHKTGTLAVITSVAADRGRSSNYIYGSAKAAVSTFVEGLRGRLFKSNIHVLEIKPGFIDTPMTQDLDLPSLLLSTPEQIASIIDKAIRKKKHCIYAPFYWWFILTIIKSIPRGIFKKLSI